MNRDELAAAASEFGDTDQGYLEVHFDRFYQTLDRCLEHETSQGGAVLDLGGHWLHQAILFTAAGFNVTAVDIPLTFEKESVRQLAAHWQIELVTCENLASPAALRAVPDNSKDMILMTEIIEHLAFNPLALWVELHRILRPGGRVIISTPNYYALRSLVPKLLRFLSLKGGGVSSASVLTQATYAHHWKEYSAREFKQYFAMLSPDLRLSRSQHVRYYTIQHRLAWLVRPIEALLPLLRPNLHIEVDLVRKDKGIVLEEQWS
jgi:2-polyprenyl-3-methyl-5-hydroxy-6-metoxy-1,4-benzoquinol methylase